MRSLFLALLLAGCAHAPVVSQTPVTVEQPWHCSAAGVCHRYDPAAPPDDFGQGSIPSQPSKDPTVWTKDTQSEPSSKMSPAGEALLSAAALIARVIVGR